MTHAHPDSLLPAEHQPHAGLPSTDLRDPIPEWDPEEVHLRDYLEVILRRKWLIVSSLVLTFLSTLILTLSQPKIYQAWADIEVSPDSEKITKFEEVVSTDMRWRESEYLGTQVELLQSPAMLRRVVARLNLATHPVVAAEVFGEGQEPGLMDLAKGAVRDLIRSLIPADRQAEGSGAGGPAVPEDVLMDQALLGFVAGGLEVASSKTSLLINVTFEATDRTLARDVVNALAEEFVTWKMEQKLEASNLARTFLMKQIDQSKINLERAEEEMNRFAKEAGIVSLDSRQNGVYRQLEELNAALAVAEAELIAREAVYQQALADGPSALPEVMESPMIAQLKGEYARLQGEYENLAVTFRDDYPAVKALMGRMQSIAGRIAAEEQKIFLAIKNQYEAARKKTATMRARVEEQKGLAIALNERATQYKIMEREVETNKQIYQSLLERTREIESMAGVSSSNIHVVDRATLPILPHKPNVRRNLLLAIAVGLMAGVGLAFFLEYFTDTITNPEEITDRFQIPILGVVPLAKGGDYPVEKTFLADPRAPLAEAMRTTRVSLQLSGAGSKAKSFLITSTRPAEGKTTLAANLALTFAGAGEKVVVVDADMRKPRIHKVFAGENGNAGPGLSSFLAGVADKGIIRANGVPNLHFIPAGPIPPNPVELLASRRFQLLMQALEKRYDRIIVDGPPHQGFADTLVLSQHVGGVVLASSLGETTRDALRHFRKSILNVRGTILGCIINKVDLTKRYGYQSYYRYYNYYSYGETPGGAGKRKKLPSAGADRAA
jgi:capsular exopolysaccharide synthesis family protein